ncbi:M23 family metallopeptidase [Desertibacillus haloalkaliphilus]|uniref:M23 family metallopeptidase n=1 Tax=Desertibacillus haloalkaliphilus TaxID=1328930 RepID=UPI001C267C4C|nr:M23 family metallopeptidase [Desertibacillus haloalkaliphilus]MBU8905907.1 M23 family metallopeptidase [Desertibacillus haloalkaliphilus]
MRKDEEKNQSSNSSNEESFNVQRFLRKRWVLPAVYLGSAALVISAVFWLQSPDEGAMPGEDFEVEEQPIGEGTEFDEEAVPVTATQEIVQMPVTDENEVEVIGQFYDYDATAEEQQAALVYYNNTYYQNKGIDLAMESGESFDVTAALSGTVVSAEKDELLGYVVQLDHDNGIVTHYQSLEEVDVEEGVYVNQGDVLGQAGRNVYNSDAGVHVHFEIRQDGVPVNPQSFFGESFETLVESKEEVAADEDIVSAEEDGLPEEGPVIDEGLFDEEPVEEAPADDEDSEEDEQEDADEEEAGEQEDLDGEEEDQDE